MMERRVRFTGSERRTPEGIRLHEPADFEGMRRAGRLAAECLDTLAEHVRPGVRTEELRQPATSEEPQRVHREQPVLRVDVARGEHRVLARGAVDVRHVERVPEHDGRAVPEDGGVRDLVLGDAERRVLEQGHEVGLGQVRRGRDQSLVQRDLVHVVFGVGAARRDLGLLRLVEMPALSRRQDVACDSGVVASLVRQDGRVLPHSDPG